MPEEGPIQEADASPQAVVVPAGAALHRYFTMAFGRPLAITRIAAEHVITAIGQRTEVSVAIVNSMGQERAPESVARPTRRQLRGVAWNEGLDPTTGIYTIKVHDKLVQRRATMNAESGLCCYDSLHGHIQNARHPDVAGVFLWADGPGGQAAGMNQVGLAFGDLAKEKPVLSWVDELAASATYGCICNTSEIWGPPNLEVGSIGVRWLHMSVKAWHEEQGLKITEFVSGRKKAFGSPYGDLDEEQIASIQGKINHLAESFFKLVAKGRGISVGAIRELEGDTFYDTKAKELGLVDQVGTREDALARLMDMIRERKTTVSTGSSPGAKGTTAPAGASKEHSTMPIHTALAAALLAMPAMASKGLTAEDLDTDLGAQEAATSIRTMTSEVGKIADLTKRATDAESTARLAQTSLQEEKDARQKAEGSVTTLQGQVATLQAENKRLQAIEEQTLWADALDEAGVKESRRENVLERAQSKRTAEQTPLQAVEGVREEGGMWADCFEEKVERPNGLTDEKVQNLGRGGKGPNTDVPDGKGPQSWNVGRPGARA